MMIHPTEAVSESEAYRIMEKTVLWIERWENMLSRFRETSELSYVNDNAGKWMTISPDFAEVLQLATDAFHLTQGMFHPAVGKIMENLGYDKSFEQVIQQSGREATTARETSVITVARPPVVVLPNPDHLPFRLSFDLAQVYLMPGYHLDLGGIAKGWIVEQAAKKLWNCGLLDFILSAGGDMVCSGNNAGRPWAIGIENPQDPKNPLLTLDVQSSCVATSGTYRRTWQREETKTPVHHLINPKTSRPAHTDIVSCTVVATHLFAAEVYAKTTLLLGSEDGIDWLSKQTQRGWVLVKDTGEVIHAWNS